MAQMIEMFDDSYLALRFSSKPRFGKR